MRPANQLADACDRRKKGRVKAHSLKCELGRIADISASGMRILRKRKPPVEAGHTTNLHIKSEIDRFTVPAKVVRVTQLDKRLWEIAVEIVNPTDEIREKLIIQARSAGMKGFAHLD